jgi:hypothetical protein
LHPKRSPGRNQAVPALFVSRRGVHSYFFFVLRAFLPEIEATARRQEKEETDGC